MGTFPIFIICSILNVRVPCEKSMTAWSPFLCRCFFMQFIRVHNMGNVHVTVMRPPIKKWSWLSRKSSWIRIGESKYSSYIQGDEKHLFLILPNSSSLTEEFWSKPHQRVREKERDKRDLPGVIGSDCTFWMVAMATIFWHDCGVISLIDNAALFLFLFKISPYPPPSCSRNLPATFQPCKKMGRVVTTTTTIT